MTEVVIDIETDGLNPSKIHCISCLDRQEDLVRTYVSNKDNCVGQYLSRFDKVIAHNGCGFDFRVLSQLWGINLPFSVLQDTLIMSMMSEHNPQGGHSLQAWGERLGFPKMDYQGGWERLTDEMVEYCEQDVRVCSKVYDVVTKALSNFSQESIRTEHMMKIVSERISRVGFKLNKQSTIELYNQLLEEQDKISLQCKTIFPPKIIDRGYSEKTGKKLKDKVIEFNPASRQQIGERLIELGWKPKKLTDTGKPKVDETTLGECPLEEAQVFARYFLLQKRTSQIKSWLKHCSEQGRVHCEYRTLGAITNRMSCVNPNLQQIPAVRTPYGKECRQVWEASPGKILIDTDASGLELRVLAHYMNDKKFIQELLTGDVHTANQKMAGLKTRDQAKTFIYALLYGAGDAKIGAVVDGSYKQGSKLRERFMKNMPAYRKFSEEVIKKGTTKGKLKAIDGRILDVRSAHASINTLIQGSSAVLMKEWFIQTDKVLRQEKVNANIVAMVHDEMVIEAEESACTIVRDSVKEAMSRVNDKFKLRCPLDCDFQTGKNWSEIH